MIFYCYNYLTWKYLSSNKRVNIFKYMYLIYDKRISLKTNEKWYKIRKSPSWITESKITSNQWRRIGHTHHDNLSFKHQRATCIFYTSGRTCNTYKGLWIIIQCISGLFQLHFICYDNCQVYIGIMSVFLWRGSAQIGQTYKNIWIKRLWIEITILMW